MKDSQFQEEYGHHLLDEVLSGRMTRRQLLVRATVIGLSSTAVAGMLTACGGGTSSQATATPSTTPKPGGILKVGMIPPTGAIDPLVIYDLGSIGVVQLVCEYLAWANADLSLRPVLAEKWEPDPEVKVWTFYLRKGVTFNDGKPFGADDVVATFKTILDPKTISASASAFTGILTADGVEKVDDSTVRFSLEEPFTDFPYIVGSSNYDCVMLPSTYELGTWEDNPVGTGPFTLVDYKPRVSAKFERNPKYWQPGLPYLDGVAHVFNEETQAQALALQAGSIDMMLVTPYESAQRLSGDSNVKVLEVSSNGHRQLHMRVTESPFQDKRVRQALAWTLDRPGLNQLLFGGKAPIGNDHPFAPDFPLSPTDIPQRNVDIAKAKQLLADAGYANGVDMTLSVEGYEEIPKYATAVQSMAKEAGINIKLDMMSLEEYYGSGENQPWLEVPMGITDWSFRSVPEQFIIPSYTSTGVWNSAQFKNPTFDQLISDYTSELDEQKRRADAKQAALLAMDETPYIIAYWESVSRAMKKNVQGVVADPQQFLDLSTANLT